MNAQLGFWLRTGLATALAFLGSLQVALRSEASMTGSAWIDVVIATLIAFGGYVGVGALTPLEPDVGLKKGTS